MKYIKPFNENVFINMVENRINECLTQIGNSFELECKDKESAKQDLIAFVEKHYAKRNQNDANSGEFYF